MMSTLWIIENNPNREGTEQDVEGQKPTEKFNMEKSIQLINNSFHYLVDFFYFPDKINPRGFPVVYETIFF